MKNIYYFRVISAIGGVEQFLYEIAKKYYKYDLTIYYDKADPYQLKRLENLVRCVKREKGKKVYCDKAFFNFNTDMIDDVIAKEYIFVIHANFEELGYHPELHPKVTKYIGVSKFACEEFEKFTGQKAELCYNPLSLEPKEKVLHLVSACRLDDTVKGGARTRALINALDKYCSKTGRHYIWHIFTNDVKQIESPNVALMKRRVDVRPYIQDADWCLQLSNDMETYCYTINEALSYGVPIVTTPLTVCNELPIPDGTRLVLNWDCSNVDEIAEAIFTTKVDKFNYSAPNDQWGDLLEKGASEYQKELRQMFRVKATKEFEKIIDNEVGRPRTEGEEWLVSAVRLKQLQEYGGLVTVIGEEVKKAEKPVRSPRNTKKNG